MYAQKIHSQIIWFQRKCTGRSVFMRSIQKVTRLVHIPAHRAGISMHMHPSIKRVLTLHFHSSPHNSSSSFFPFPTLVPSISSKLFPQLNHFSSHQIHLLLSGLTL
ncbi:hypothetical protein ACH5RR_033787 [Cinchona calisaya]|uniref:Uncharacterized protein n=1 Tax=Cinchona calisaya TaxID=153742 RepID=A0ABD2Y905_9GENT